MEIVNTFTSSLDLSFSQPDHNGKYYAWRKACEEQATELVFWELHMESTGYDGIMHRARGKKKHD